MTRYNSTLPSKIKLVYEYAMIAETAKMQNTLSLHNKSQLLEKKNTFLNILVFKYK